MLQRVEVDRVLSLCAAAGLEGVAQLLVAESITVQDLASAGLAERHEILRAMGLRYGQIMALNRAVDRRSAEADADGAGDDGGGGGSGGDDDDEGAAAADDEEPVVVEAADPVEVPVAPGSYCVSASLSFVSILVSNAPPTRNTHAPIGAILIG